MPRPTSDIGLALGCEVPDFYNQYKKRLKEVALGSSEVTFVAIRNYLKYKFGTHKAGSKQKLVWGASNLGPLDLLCRSLSTYSAIATRDTIPTRYTLREHNINCQK